MLNKAINFAKEKHKGQFRNNTNIPYITHPEGVLLKTKLLFPNDETMQILAILHDVVEDTDVTLDDIESLFGKDIRDKLYYLTAVSKPEDGNRKIRKEIDKNHHLSGTLESIIIKFIDMIDNLTDLNFRRQEFAWKEKYLSEKREFLDTYNRKIGFLFINHPYYNIGQYLLLQLYTIIALLEDNIQNEKSIDMQHAVIDSYKNKK